MSDTRNNREIPQNEVKAVTREELWSAARKTLLLEEPAEKSARLKRFAKRRLPKEKVNDKTAWSEIYPLWEKLGGGYCDLGDLCLSRLFSLVIGLCDLRRFEEIAFASWEKQEFAGSPRGVSGSAPRLSGPVDFVEIIAQIGRSQKLSSSQIQWLLHCVEVAFDWPRFFSEPDGALPPDAGLLAFLKEAFGRLQGCLATLEHCGGVATVEQARRSVVSLADHHARFLPGDFLPRAVMLVEGPTELLLLPELSRLCGSAFDQHRVMVVSAGGARQVLKRFIEMRDLIALPLVCLLDRDAGVEAESLQDLKRDRDRVFVLQSGEIEDCFGLESFVAFINHYLARQPSAPPPATMAEFRSGGSRKESLARLWRKRNLGAFDKVAVAQSIIDEMKSAEAVPEELKRILEITCQVALDVDA